MDLKKISYFLAWTGFTFLSNWFAKLFLVRTEHLIENVIVLSTCQMASGSIIYLMVMISGKVNYILSHLMSPFQFPNL